MSKLLKKKKIRQLTFYKSQNKVRKIKIKMDGGFDWWNNKYIFLSLIIIIIINIK